MNEVALHRGSSPHLNTIDAFVDRQHLTEAVVSTAIQRAIQNTSTKHDVVSSQMV